MFCISWNLFIKSNRPFYKMLKSPSQAALSRMSLYNVQSTTLPLPSNWRFCSSVPLQNLNKRRKNHAVHCVIISEAAATVHTKKYSSPPFLHKTIKHRKKAGWRPYAVAAGSSNCSHKKTFLLPFERKAGWQKPYCTHWFVLHGLRGRSSIDNFLQLVGRPSNHR